MKVVVGEVIVAMPIARMPSTGSAVPGTGAAMPLAASKARSTHRPSKMRASACKMTGAAEMGSAAKTPTSEVRPTDEASTGEVASPTETSSSSETSRDDNDVKLCLERPVPDSTFLQDLDSAF
jgi:hypothetical protein